MDFTPDLTSRLVDFDYQAAPLIESYMLVPESTITNPPLGMMVHLGIAHSYHNDALLLKFLPFGLRVLFDCWHLF